MISAFISNPQLRIRKPDARPAPCVVIAQDDGAARQRLAAVLRQDGYTIVELSSVARLGYFLMASGSQPPANAVIAELDLADHTVSDLLACLHLRECHMPLILLSARVDRRLVEQAYRLGAVAILGPAYDLEVMRGIVRNVTG